MTTEYVVWVDKGQALIGEFCPAGTVCDRPLIRLKVGPPGILTNEMTIFFWDEADMVTTARTLRQITEAIERTLWPELEPDWGNLPGPDPILEREEAEREADKVYTDHKGQEV